MAAGGGGNVAVALAAWGYEVTAIGNSVGDDPLGRIIVTPDGQRTIIGSDYTTVTWMPVADWDHIAAIVVDGYSGPAGEVVIRQAADRNLPVVATDRGGPETAGVSMLLWSADEHPDPAEAAAVATRGPRVVVTNGPRPITVFEPDGSAFTVEPNPQVARDSTGTGDVFAAAVTAGLGEGLPAAMSLERAADVAARYVTAGLRSHNPAPH